MNCQARDRHTSYAVLMNTSSIVLKNLSHRPHCSTNSYIRCCKWQETILVVEISLLFLWKTTVVVEVLGEQFQRMENDDSVDALEFGNGSHSTKYVPSAALTGKPECYTMKLWLPFCPSKTVVESCSYYNYVTRSVTAWKVGKIQVAIQEEKFVWANSLMEEVVKLLIIYT